MAGGVFVSGYGVVAPTGLGSGALWDRVLDAKPMARFVPELDDAPVPYACTVDEAHLTGEGVLSRSEIRRFPRIITMSVVAAAEAMTMAQLATADLAPERAGVVFGTCLGPAALMLEAELNSMVRGGPAAVSPMVTPYVIPNAIPSTIAIRYGFTGPNLCVSTACSAGTHAIGEAYELVRSGVCDVVLAGGGDAMVSPFTVSAFWRVGALARDAEPAMACRPFDADRSGFVLGEGAAWMVLESESHLERRGGTPRSKVVGYGRICEAYHPTDPRPDGSGIAAPVRAALRREDVAAESVDYVNAHGTGTVANDIAEARALVSVFGDRLPLVSSTKAVTGHLLGGAGAVEAVVTSLVLEHQVVPGTANLEQLDPAIADLGVPVVRDATSAHVGVAVSNSCAIGGQNAAIVLARAT